MELLTNLTLLACLCSALTVTCTTFVIVDFLSDASKRYKERYIEETSVQYDDILLQMPPEKIFDLSLAFSALGGFIAIGFVTFFTGSISIPKLILFGLLSAGAAFPLPRVYLRYLKNQRLNKFNEQLEDVLLSISGSLKAGFSLPQALDEIARMNRYPISMEFTLLTHELRLGVNFEEAFTKMTNRVGSNDFELVSIAIITARQTGGELTNVLERLAYVIRERMRITRKVTALTAQGKLQAMIIGAMPFLLLVAMARIEPDLVNGFINSPLGIMLLIAAIGLVVTGILVIRKIITIDI